MSEITLFIEWIQNIGFIGVLIILAVPRLRQRIFGMNGYDIMRNEIEGIAQRLKQHMDDEEVEMKKMQDDMRQMREDVSYIKGKLAQ